MKIAKKAPQEGAKSPVVRELDAVLAKARKDLGDSIGGRGVKAVHVPRIPTGIFIADLATGGGWPKGRLGIVYGPESSGKTTLALLTCAWVQHHCFVCQEEFDSCSCSAGPTIKDAVYIDQEHALDAVYARRLGVDLDRLVLLQPDTAVQCVDLVEGVLSAEDTGVLVVDSIASMVTDAVINASAERVDVGGNSVVVQRMVQKAGVALTREARRGHYPLLLCINQTRSKIGVMFGNPESMPGGAALKFASSMTIRVYGKDVIDKKFSDVLPAFKEVNASINKWKVPIVSKSFTYNQCLIDQPGLSIGQVRAWPHVEGYLRDYGLLFKNEKGIWMCPLVGGEVGEFKTLSSIAEKFESDSAFSLFLRGIVVEREVNRAMNPVSL